MCSSSIAGPNKLETRAGVEGARGDRPPPHVGEGSQNNPECKWIALQRLLHWRVKKSVCYFVNGVVYKRKFVMRLSVLNCSCTRSPLALLRRRLKCPGRKGRGEDGGDGGGGASLSWAVELWKQFCQLQTSNWALVERLLVLTMRPFRFYITIVKDATVTLLMKRCVGVWKTLTQNVLLSNMLETCLLWNNDGWKDVDPQN